MQSKINAKFLGVLLLSFMSAFPVFAQLEKAKATIDETYTKLIKKNKIVGASIVIIDKGEVVYSKGFGFEDQANNIKATPESIYKIASVTKSLTALAVIQLYEKGLLDINESIKKYIPELTMNSRFEDGNEIYIKDILTHTSGLPSDILNGMIASEVPDLDWLIAELNKQQTASPNNFYISYSNVGYGLLGLLIERVSGLSYADYMQQNVFAPLEMSNSFGNNTDPENLVKGYADKKEILPEKSINFGACCIASSALDLANFTQMLMQNGKFKGKTILSEKAVALMEQNWQANNTLPTAENYGYGMDLRPVLLKNKQDSQKGTFLAHSGDEIAFHAVYGYIPEIEVGAIILTNTDTGLWIRSASRLLKLYLKETKGITMEFADEQLDFNKTLISDNQLTGSYNIGMGLLEVKDANKIKFEVDGTKVTLKRIANTNDYSIKALLLGFIPIPIKDVIFRFENRNNQIYLIQVEVGEERGEYLGEKVAKVPLPYTWKKQVGSYKIINAFESNAPDFDFTNSSVELFEEDGWCVLEIKTATIIRNYLNIESDKMATTGGIGRQTGIEVKILENGNLYFSGFEMEKIKD